MKRHPMNSKAYTRDELLVAADGRWPDRGDRCDRCGTIVPQFAELTKSDLARIRQLAVSGQVVLAQRELEACTGAPPRFAKIWVIHCGVPSPKLPGTPCPHCGKPLASSRARQCLRCHKDWH